MKAVIYIVELLVSVIFGIVVVVASKLFLDHPIETLLVILIAMDFRHSLFKNVK